MKRRMRKLRGIVVVFVLFLATFMCIEAAFAASVRFRIVALNPSSVKTQSVPLKVYLPVEIKPQDVIDSGGLNLEYDSDKSLYYVYKDGVILKPRQTKIFEVEVKDVWIIPQRELDNVLERVKLLSEVFKDTAYYVRMQNIVQNAETLIGEIAKTQKDESLSRSQHIGIYRTNSRSLDKIKKEIAEMEQLLESKTGPLTPDIFDKSKFKTRTPTKTATWLIIFAVIMFLGLLSIVFFFTWYQQSKVSHGVISEGKKTAFGEEEPGKPSEPKQKKE